MRCGDCDKTDGLCYASLPPKVKCTVTGEYHLYDDECSIERQPAVGAIDLLTQLHDAVQSDECMWSCDKISILNKITQLEQALEKYSG
mgnify:CR=1 FL=1